MLRSRSRGFAFCPRDSEPVVRFHPSLRISCTDGTSLSAVCLLRTRLKQLRVVGFPLSVPLAELRLATKTDSLARVSRRILEARSGEIAFSVAGKASLSICSFGPQS